MKQLVGSQWNRPSELNEREDFLSLLLENIDLLISK